MRVPGSLERDATTQNGGRLRPALQAVLAALLLGGVAALAAAPAAAASITVTTTSDTAAAGECTLREALHAANSDTAVGGCVAGNGSDTITFAGDVTGTIQLTATLPAISTAMTIIGPGADVLAVRGDRGATTPVVRNLMITPNGTLSLSGLMVSDVEGDFGGAIGNEGTLTLTAVTLTGNLGAGFTVSDSFGGGVANSGTLTVVDSAITGNEASFGAGIYNGGTATLVNSTVAGNGGNLGGGLYNSGTATLTHVTLADNVAFSNGGGVYAAQGAQTSLKASIVSNNTLELPALGGEPNCYPGVVDLGHNLGFGGGCGFSTANGSLPNNDPLLDGLATGDGATPTMVPGSSSPALDAVPLTNGACATGASVDQRGVLRPQGVACDIGAVEVAPPAPMDTTAPSVTITAPADEATYLVGVPLLADYSCDDGVDGSGVATCEGTVSVGSQVDTITTGQKTFTVSTSDNAGNAADATVSFTVVEAPDLILGFGPPVSVEGLNPAKAGRAVPLKFSVQDASGAPVVLGTSQVRVISHPCGSAPLTFPVDGASTGGSGLQSFGDGLYQVNIATQKSWARTCRTLGIDLGSDVTLTADFTFSS